MASKSIYAQHNFQVRTDLETVPSGFVGLAPKTDGLYLRRNGESSKRLLTEDDLSGSNNYIQNQFATIQTANYKISGNGVIMGNLGIGMLNPPRSLSVFSDQDRTDEYGAAIFAGNNATGHTYLYYTISQLANQVIMAGVRSGIANDVQFLLNPQGGNVGINTYSATSPLTFGSLGSSETRYINLIGLMGSGSGISASGSYGQSMILDYDYGNQSDYDSFQIRANGNQIRLQIDNAGNAGIGIAPTRKLDINGAVRIRTITDQTAYPIVLVADNNGNIDGVLKSSFGTGNGSVTSVDLSLPNEFSVTSSPITSSGTLTAIWQQQAANKVLASPVSGSPGTPGFRYLVAADIPALDYAATNHNHAGVYDNFVCWAFGTNAGDTNIYKTGTTSATGYQGIRILQGSGVTISTISSMDNYAQLTISVTGFEPALGNPTNNGDVLTSSNGGVRSWMPFPTNYWQRSSGTLSQATANDRLQINSNVSTGYILAVQGSVDYSICILGSHSGGGTGIEGFSLSGTGGRFASTTGVPLSATIDPATTNVSEQVLALYRTTSGTPAVGIGAHMTFYVEGNTQTPAAAKLGTVLTAVGSGVQSSKFQLYLISGGTMALKMEVSDTGILYLPGSYARVSGSDVTYTGQTMTAITGLSIPLIAGETYEFEAVLQVGTSAVTTGVQYGVWYTGASATVTGTIIGSYTTSADKSERISSFGASGVFLTSSSQTGGIQIKGTITVVSGAGNLHIRHLKNTSGTSTVFIGSFLKVRRIA